MSSQFIARHHFVHGNLSVARGEEVTGLSPLTLDELIQVGLVEVQGASTFANKVALPVTKPQPNRAAKPAARDKAQKNQADEVPIADVDAAIKSVADPIASTEPIGGEAKQADTQDNPAS